MVGLKYSKVVHCSDESSIVVTFDNSTPDLIGFSIIRNKFLKKKVANFEHVLLDKSTATQLRACLESSEESFTKYFSCSCYSEIIRVIKFKNEPNIFIDIFDNYTLKLKKGIETSAELSPENVKDFTKILDFTFS